MPNKCKSEEDNLPEVVEGIKKLTMTNGITKRVLRKRIPKCIPESEISKRRCNQKPKKRTFSEMDSDDDIKLYYLDKSVKKTFNALETIFEEDEKSCLESVSQPQMSTKRFKRMINFQKKANDIKQKKRRMKIKKVFGSTIFRSGRMDLKDVLKKLEQIQSNSSSLAEKEEINSH